MSGSSGNMTSNVAIAIASLVAGRKKPTSQNELAAIETVLLELLRRQNEDATFRGEEGVYLVYQGAQELTGGPGPQGEPGVQGVQGERGERGPQGDQGLQGSEGNAGPEGRQGPAGPTGRQGDQGVPGSTGAEGPQGLTGSTGEKGDSGSKGDKGDKGDQGIMGLQGETGPQGPGGPEGPQGLKGDKGDTGAQGVDGPQGPIGPPGLTGNTGSKGVTGATGPAGSNQWLPTVRKTTLLVSSSVVAQADIPELFIDLVAGELYEFDAYLTFQSVATTTGATVGFTAAGLAKFSGTVEGGIVSVTSASNLSRIVGSLAVGAISITTTGVTAINSNHAVIIRGVMSSSVDERIILRLGSEVAASTVSLQIGSTLVIKRVA